MPEFEDWREDPPARTPGPIPDGQGGCGCSGAGYGGARQASDIADSAGIGGFGRAADVWKADGFGPGRQYRQAGDIAVFAGNRESKCDSTREARVAGGVIGGIGGMEHTGELT